MMMCDFATFVFGLVVGIAIALGIGLWSLTRELEDERRKGGAG